MNTVACKSSENVEESRQVKRITWIGIFVNLGLAAIKAVVGVLGASQAVIADAVHSLSDTGTDVAILLGVRFWSAPPDENHPYGHMRIETLITTSIGILLAAVGIGIGYNAIDTIRDETIVQTTWIAIVGPLVSIIVKEILYRRTVAIGARIRSNAVIANAWHHRSDALSSIPALIAVAASSIDPEWAFVDKIGALIVSLFILKVAWDITKPALDELTESGVSAENRTQIHAIASSVEKVEEVHKIRTRKVGPNIFVDLHVLVDPNMTVYDGHLISEKVQEKLVAEGPDVVDVVVHLEPAE